MAEFARAPQRAAAPDDGRRPHRAGAPVRRCGPGPRARGWWPLLVLVVRRRDGSGAVGSTSPEAAPLLASRWWLLAQLAGLGRRLGRGGRGRLPGAAPAARWRSVFAGGGGAAAGGAGRATAHVRRPLPLLVGRAGAGRRHQPVRVHAGIGAAWPTCGSPGCGPAERPCPLAYRDARLHPDQPVLGAHDLPAGGRSVVRRHLPADRHRRPLQAVAGRRPAHRRAGRRAADDGLAPAGPGPPLGGALRPLPRSGAGDRQQRPRRRPGHPPGAGRTDRGVARPSTGDEPD